VSREASTSGRKLAEGSTSLPQGTRSPSDWLASATPEVERAFLDQLSGAAASRHLVEKPLEAAATGDVLLFRMRAQGVAKHLGIQSETGATPRFVHAYSGHGVVEGSLAPSWSRRIVARFAFPKGI
jgi:NlpC/P60 family putative phage cell wall peptidase